MRVMALLVMVALKAAAQTPADVEALYADGEFATAVKKADTAIAKSKIDGDVAKLQVTKGLSLLALGKSDKAKAAFTAALKRDAASKLDETRVPPEAMTLFESARAELLVTVKIEVEGGEASVRIDGASAGPAPLTMKLPVGLHTFEAKAADAREAKAEQLIAFGADTRVALKLPAPPPPPPEPQAATTTPPLETAVAATPEPQPAIPAVTANQRPEAPKRTFWGLIPLGLGVAIAATSSIFFIQAAGDHDYLTRASSVYDPEGVAKHGAFNQTMGWVFAGVGGAAAIAGIIMLALPPSSPKQPTVSFFVAPAGGGVSVQGNLP